MRTRVDHVPQGHAVALHLLLLVPRLGLRPHRELQLALSGFVFGFGLAHTLAELFAQLVQRLVLAFFPVPSRARRQVLRGLPPAPARGLQLPLRVHLFDGVLVARQRELLLPHSELAERHPLLHLGHGGRGLLGAPAQHGAHAAAHRRAAAGSLCGLAQASGRDQCRGHGGSPHVRSGTCGQLPRPGGDWRYRRRERVGELGAENLPEQVAGLLYVDVCVPWRLPRTPSRR
mmetsp:Transcript_64530/g.167828  ORF Transcript_64530/g.167828 Transcript_64530/m.167828 type:complete len:231 (-) Transcript_64530:206-898(-)